MSEARKIPAHARVFLRPLSILHELKGADLVEQSWSSCESRVEVIAADAGVASILPGIFPRMRGKI